MIAVVVIALDQVTKAIVRSTMTISESIPLWEDVFHLTYVRNTGAAFGLMPGQRLLFVGTSMLVLAFVAAFWRRDKPAAWPVVVSIALVTGGAVGNLIDRALIGRVTDFFHFALIDFPVFNIADSAIVVGVIMLMAWLLFGPDPAAVEPSSESCEPIEMEEPDDES